MTQETSRTMMVVNPVTFKIAGSMPMYIRVPFAQTLEIIIHLPKRINPHYLTNWYPINFLNVLLNYMTPIKFTASWFFKERHCVTVEHLTRGFATTPSPHRLSCQHLLTINILDQQPNFC